MLKALIGDEAVISLDCTNKTLEYRCPECGERVILKRGTKKVPHFAHEAHAACLNSGESIHHIRAKAWLFDHLRKDDRVEEVDAECTRWPGIRPDVAYKLKNRDFWVGVEFQRSGISDLDIVDRCSRYKENGVYIMWCVTEDVFHKVSPRDACKFDEVKVNDQIKAFIKCHDGLFGFTGDGIAICEYHWIYRERQNYNYYTGEYYGTPWLESLSQKIAIAKRRMVDICELDYYVGNKVLGVFDPQSSDCFSKGIIYNYMTGKYDIFTANNGYRKTTA